MVMDVSVVAILNTILVIIEMKRVALQTSFSHCKFYPCSTICLKFFRMIIVYLMNFQEIKIDA